MIIDLNTFLEKGRPHWQELEAILKSNEAGLVDKLSLDEIKRFHYLFERASADLVELNTYAYEPETSKYLESLVARAYSIIHTTSRKFNLSFPITWFFYTFPQTFRRNIKAFYLSLIIMILGGTFGAYAISFDTEAKSVIMPFSHLSGSPAERVKKEETEKGEHLKGSKSTFSAYLMTHNTRVSILTMALGITWGIGTIILLFYNGVILGAVAADYVIDGQTSFLFGWLLPHGVVEIPAILIAGQAGLVLASALIIRNRRLGVKKRLKERLNDLATLIGGLAIMLIWAGIVEAFMSQYHEPVLPYSLKICFGVFELIILIFFLSYSGRKIKQISTESSHNRDNKPPPTPQKMTSH